MSFKKSIVSLVAGLALVACGGGGGTSTTPPTPSSELYTISGTVKGAKQVVVTLYATDDHKKLASVITDSAYRFADLEGGKYTIVPTTKDGATFSPVEKEVDLVANVQVNFEVVVVATYTVSGTIKNGAGAVLSMVVNGKTLQATADGQGKYTIEKVPNGTYAVTASLANYKFTEGSTQAVTVKGSNATLDFTAERIQESTYTVAGAIYISYGQYLDTPEGVFVTVTRGATTVSVVRAVAGRFQFVVPNGTYVLTATGNGHNFSAPVTITVAGANYGGDSVLYFTSAPIPPATHSLSGKIYGYLGEAPTIQIANEGTTKQASVNVQGVFTFDGLLPGNYVLTPSMPVVQKPRSFSVSDADVTGVAFGSALACDEVVLEADGGWFTLGGQIASSSRITYDVTFRLWTEGPATFLSDSSRTLEVWSHPSRQIIKAVTAGFSPAGSTVQPGEDFSYTFQVDPTGAVRQGDTEIAMRPYEPSKGQIAPPNVELILGCGHY